MVKKVEVQKRRAKSKIQDFNDFYLNLLITIVINIIFQASRDTWKVVRMTYQLLGT